MVSSCSARPGGDQEKPSIGRSRTRRPPTSKTPRATLAAPAAPTTPAAALVEDEPSSSTAKRRKVHVDPIVRDWFLDMSHQWKTQRRWSMQQCLCEVQRRCLGMFDGINPNTPHRWKRSAPAEAPLGRRTLLSPADMTRLSEHILRVSDVLCLSAVTIRGLVLEWLDAEGFDVRPSEWWIRRLLHSTCLSHKKPATPQPYAAARELASALHQAVLADEHTRRQRRPRREHRRDFVPPPPGATDRVGPPRRAS